MDKVYKKQDNVLYEGDNLLIMQALLNGDPETGLPSMRGKIDLIYIDPPYCCDTDKKFGMIPWKKNTQPKNRVDEILPLMSEQDIGVTNYLRWMYPRLYLMRELLSDQGSIYVHVDWHVGHYLKLILDEIFGKDNFKNEIIWAYKSGGAGENCYAKKHDYLYFYSKNKSYMFEAQKYKRYVDKSKGYDPRITYYYDEIAQKEYRLNILSDLWDDIGIISPNGFERTGYLTQKPEALLERIIKASSIENSIVADFFAGSGTTGAVAEKLGRKWIMSDNNLDAIKTIKTRLKI